MRREVGSALGALAPLAAAVEALVLLLDLVIWGLALLIPAVDMVDALLDQKREVDLLEVLGRTTQFLRSKISL